MSLIQQQAKFWLKALIRIVDVINTQYSNETGDLITNGPFAAYGYLKDGDAGARKWSVVDRLMQGADAMGHAQEARNNIEDMYAAQPSVPYTDQPANHTAAVQTPTTDNTPPITDEPITTTATSDASAEPIDITPSAVVIKEVQTDETNISQEIKNNVTSPVQEVVSVPINTTPFNADIAVKNANAPYGGGLTNAGRALTKHPNIVNATNSNELMKMYKNNGNINKAAKEVIDNIVKNGSQTFKNTKNFGDIIDYKLPSGLGVRFTTTNKFIGFLGRGL